MKEYGKHRQNLIATIGFATILNNDRFQNRRPKISKNFTNF